jgi:AraC family transcriptional activator of pyochelin receptor
MQKARQLFDRAEMNVSQVAWTIGYTNVSQFTKAYKKRFGVLPKHYLKSALIK